MKKDKRIRIIVGHYGSGKTEFTVNYGIGLSKQNEHVTIADLDVVNPYFRSREKQGVLEAEGIRVIGSSLEKNTGADLPAISSSVIAPLQDEHCNVLLDIGGDSTGARVLARYKKYFIKNQYDMLCVVNTNRLETSTVEGILFHIRSIEAVTGLEITGLVNNTHLFHKTTVDDVLEGHAIIEEASRAMKIPIKYVSVKTELVKDVSYKVDCCVLPIDMFMREEWM